MVRKECEREKIKIIVPFRSVLTQRVRENSKKIAKKLKKLKNTIVASFQPIIGCKRPRNRENKNYRSVLFPTSNRKFKKTNKKIQKIKKYHYGFISSHNRVEKDEKERILKLSFRFVPTRRVTENFKKIAKKFKI